MCMAPFLFLASGIDLARNHTLLNHEKIHFRQQIELAWIPFFIWYVVEYLIRLIITRSHTRAYLNISFEREAYAHAGDPGYLSSGKPYSWFRYLFINYENETGIRYQ